MGFRYAEPEKVVLLLKGGKLVGWRRDALELNLELISTRLSAWYPGLRQRWTEAPEYDDLKGLVTAMVISAGVKLAKNPEGMSSETMGPYAYSKFDSEDPSKGLFEKRDVEALEKLLAAENNRAVHSFKPSGRVGPFRPSYGGGFYL